MRVQVDIRRAYNDNNQSNYILLLFYVVIQAQLEEDVRQLLDIKDRLEQELSQQRKPTDDPDLKRQLAKLKVTSCL